MERSDGAYFICWTAKATAALCTSCCPRRVIAERKSVRGLPEVLNAAELAVCSSRAARRRLVADDGDGLIEGGIRIRQCVADSDDDVRKTGQIHGAL